MINCIICDDEKRMAETAQAILEDALRECECVGNISTYTDSRLLVSDIVEYKPIDIAVIDIEMPHYDGIYIAEEIKRHFPDSFIIFLTSHVQYAVKSYELSVFRYAQKSEIHESLKRYIKEAIQLQLLQNEYAYTVIKNDSMERVPYRQILCIKKDGKYSVLRCVDKREIRVRKPLRKVIDELNPSEFMVIDRGCIVNIALIIRVSDREVICRNGEHLPISRSKLRETKVKVAQYWGSRI